MKKLVSLLICLILCVSVLSTVCFAERVKVGYAGDLNLDEKANIVDIVLIRANIKNGSGFDENQQRCADINTDNKIDNTDIVYLRNIIVNSKTIGEAYITKNLPEIDTSKPLVALTFDDGPNVTTTKEVLEVLEKHGVVASFFVIGNNIDDNSAKVMLDAYLKGNEINSHSTAHEYMDQMTVEEIKEDIENTSDLIFNVIGEYPKFFRPPYLAVSDEMWEPIDMGFICGVGCNDWNNKVTVEERIEKTLKKTKDGTIILLHDASGNSKTVEAIDTIIPKLLSEGYQFVTVSQLFEAKGVTPEIYELYTVVN